MIRAFTAIFLIVFFSLNAFCGIGLRSDVTGITGIRRDEGKTEVTVGGLWLPELHMNAGFQNKSCDFLAGGRFNGLWYNREKTETTLEFYRFWGRFSGPFWDLRGGLQKIAFGPAQLFRPLMWFDELDPADPLGLTRGVRGMRGRLFFANNTNIWGWALYRNDRLKGREIYSTEDHTLEYGGRLQFPVSQGEWGISWHSRIPEYSTMKTETRTAVNTGDNQRETRLGFDAQWDLLAGIWFESVVIHAPGAPVFSWIHDYVVGVDYTFPLGNGLHVLSEFGMNALFDKDLNSLENSKMAGLMVNYPLDFFTALSGFFMWFPDRDLMSLVGSFEYTSGNITYYLQYIHTITSENIPVPDLPGISHGMQVKGMISWQIAGEF
jgi:hypothetical protein